MSMKLCIKVLISFTWKNLGFSFVIGTSIYPICPVGSVATCFDVFWMIVAQMSGLSSVNTSIQMKFVRNLVAKYV